MRRLSIYLAMIEGEAAQDKFERLYHAYRDLMFYRAKQLLPEKMLAEDAVGTALLEIAQNMNKVDEVISPRTKALVMRILECTAIDLYRKWQRECSQNVPMDEIEQVADDADLIDWTGSALAKAILQLPLPYRQAILLKYAGGYSNKEIAALLGYTIDKVEKLMSRGKRKLRRLLEEVPQ